MAHDITDRKRIEEELRAAKCAAEAARRAKHQFIAVLSHEPRTPLTPAAAALPFLRKDVRMPHDVREGQGAKSIRWENFKAADFGNIGGVVCVDWLKLGQRRMRVTLEWLEVLLSATVGVRRQLEAPRSCRPVLVRPGQHVYGRGVT